MKLARLRVLVVVAASATALLGTACSSEQIGSLSATSVDAVVATTAGSAPVSDSVSSTSVATPPSSTQAVAAVSASSLYSFAGNLLGGGRYTGTEHRDRPLVLWFWAPT